MPCATTIERTVIQPLVYFWWVLGIYYNSFPQAVLWIILVGVIILIEIGSFSAEGSTSDGKRDVRKPVQGPTESLAGWFLRAPDGLYFKWLIAQRLGKLSRELIAFNARQAAPSAHEALRGPGWDPPDEVAAYLEVRPERFLRRLPASALVLPASRPTPLDLDPETAIDYIESTLEKT